MIYKKKRCKKGSGPKISKLQTRERRDSLFSLGFTYYWEYLKSDLWKRIRNNILKRDGYICRFCGCKANQVHHTSYNIDTMRGNNTTHLHSCCRRCHNKGHKNREAVLPDKV